MELIGFIQVFNIIVIAIGTLLYMRCRPSSAADSDVADSAADSAADSDVADSATDSTAVADDDDDADIPSRREKYDVFISFRGEDTGLTFTSHLHDALLQKKIETYIDNRLHRGKEIGPALLEAIEKSTISVIVFSQNYASCTWCLDELVHILKCKERFGQMVIPIFYHTNASDVRKQHRSYGDAFAQHQKRFKDSIDKVHKWREALTNAANISGFHLSKNAGTDADLIKEVVKDIWTKLCRKSSYDLKGFVGIESRIEQIESLLGIHSPDACITVGIWGMDGIGKTTLAEAVFLRHSSKFEASCFVKNVRKNSEQADGLDHLEKALLKEILKEEVLPRGSTTVRKRLSRTKVLIVLDDVSDSMQMERLAGDRLRYGTGSRIIITSRDSRTLGQTVEKDKIYEVQGLKLDDAIQLFCSRAFKNNSTRRTDYKELAEKAVDYARSVPLALIVLGSLFFNCKSKQDWENEFNKLKRFPSESILRVLRLSYDGLERHEKEIFLDLACFHQGRHVDMVKRMLDVRGFLARAGIRFLIDMSLISTDSKWGRETIEMHDLLEEMGRTIVRVQCIEDPGKRNRLFTDEDVYHVLKCKRETPIVQAVQVNWSKIEEQPLKRANFKKMSNLIMLIVDNSGIFDSKFTDSLDLPDSLRYLYWPEYPLQSLPSKFYPENLVELHMPYSQVQKLWKEDQILVNLQVIDLACSNLTEVPNLSGSPKIVRINLHGCKNLKYLPEMPENIRYLDLRGSGIKELPESVWSNENISYLEVSHCKYLEKLPSNRCKLKVSGCFNLDHCTSLGEFSELPRDISKLSLVGCERLVSLPTNICKLKYLEELNLFRCFEFGNFPEILEPMEHLKFLNLSETAVTKLHSSIEFLPALKRIQLQGCKRLSSIPKSVCKLKYLEELDLSSCSQLENFPDILEPMEHLKSLNLSGTAIEELHSSIESLPALKRIQLQDCKRLSSIPKSICKLKYLEELNLSRCSKLENFPEILEGMEHLKSLNLSGTAIDKLHSSIAAAPAAPADADDTKTYDADDMAAASSSAAAAPDADDTKKYDVFISFRGEDTRCTFTSHLHTALLEKKITTYIDDEFKRGDEIAPALLKAIEESELSVIIFSQNYASSTWCLEELVHILKCNKREGQMVIPVFYDINPSDVRKQQGNYAVAFAQLEKRFKDNIGKVHKWRDALTTAANLCGFDYSNKSGTEADLIQKVVDHIWTQLCRKSSCNLRGFVGIESRIEQIEFLLGIHSPDACITVGIWGMAGIGKTTLAEAVFRRHSSKFEASCFLKNIRQNSEQAGGLGHLEKTLLKEILKEEVLPTGSTIVRKRLSRTKVLIVLDDVSDSMQMERLAGDRLRYGTGSRVIITSRDRYTFGQTVEEDKIYEVQGLKPDDALQLFCSCAFKNNSTRRADYKELAEKAVHYAGGVPSALTILGSLFFNCKSKEDWEDEFNKLKRFPNESIQKELRISYDSLEENEKEIFLDIACFHKGWPLNEVKRMLDIRGFFTTVGIRNLIDMSLISIDSKRGRETIEMHDLLEEMGRTIVRAQCIEDPGKWNRLFTDEDVYHVLKYKRETPIVQAIRVNWSKIEELPLKRANFKKISNLIMLIVDSSGTFDSKFTDSLDLPNSLRYLYWPEYPLESLPSKFSPKNLVELHMPYSQVQKLWKEDQILVNLQVIDLACSNLTEVPNLSGSPKIVHINLHGCYKLVEIPGYFQHLDKLTHLDLGRCKNLKYLPEMPENIRYLDLQGSGIKELPESVWSNENISYLEVSHCKYLEVLPSNRCKLKVSGCFNLDHCTSLFDFSELPRDISKLSLVGCERLVSLPTNICKLKYLEELDLSSCSELENFPEILEPMEHLKSLNLSGTSVKELHSSIEFLPALKRIQLQDCKRLSSIPKSIWKLKYMEELNLSRCSELENLPEILEPMEHLKSLNLSGTAIEDLHSSIAAASSSSAAAPFDADDTNTYDVFISFRGENTRRTFTSHLHAALLEKKITTYIDDKLKRGDEIAPALLKAVEKSQLSVIIFSKDYASSTWCLDELVHILECKEKHGLLVIPIFYDTLPSDVRKQWGSYAVAFDLLEQRFENSIDKVHKWRDALTTAANISGFDSKNYGTDADLVKKVVEDIWTKLCRKSSCDLEGLVGIESRIERIESLLGIHSQDACITVGILGMGGIGKTTLAEAVFHRLSSKFEACCFLRNVRERAQKDGLENLQNTLLSQILKEEGLTAGSTFVGDRLSRTKVLIVLDDVSDSKQMVGLAGNGLRFGTGSRIIITSRNMGTLRQIVEEDNIYEVGGLKPDDALQLFCSRAFKNNCTPRTDYKELAKKVVAYAGGVPLALILLGSSFLNCKSKEDWEDELNKLKEFPNENIKGVLRISYDGLGRNEKEIFLDIACFHKGTEVNEVIKMLATCGRFAVAAGIRVLADMSLISVHSKSSLKTIEMHDLVEEMGRTIVQEECIEDPGKRNWLFNDEDEMHDLVEEMGRTIVQEECIEDPGKRNWFNDEDEMHDLVEEMGRTIVQEECIEDPGKRSWLFNVEDVYRVPKNNKDVYRVPKNNRETPIDQAIRVKKLTRLMSNLRLLIHRFCRPSRFSSLS